MGSNKKIKCNKDCIITNIDKSSEKQIRTKDEIQLRTKGNIKNESQEKVVFLSKNFEFELNSLDFFDFSTHRQANNLSKDELQRKKYIKCKEHGKYLRYINKRKYKIDSQHVDFVNELGYKQYIHLVLTKIFTFLSDKDISSTFCVSKTWNNVLSQNTYIKNRRKNYVKNQIEEKKKIGFENWPIKKKDFKLDNRRILGEMTNRILPINR